MCGRFSLKTPTQTIAAAFDVADPPDLTARYNVAPTQVIAVVGLKPDGVKRGIALLRWGLVPHWSQSPADSFRSINIRAESVDFKFGGLLREKRCLIPADGFFEWRKEGTKKLPQWFTMKTGEPFAFAGLWDAWGEGKQRLLTCAMITTTANDVVRPFHDRMPVILPREHYAEWLDHDTPVARLTSLLKPYPADEMQVLAVDSSVNSPKNDGPECIQAA